MVTSEIKSEKKLSFERASKRAALLSLVGILIVVSSLVYSSYKFSSVRKEVERQVREKEARVGELNEKIDELNERKKKLDEQLDYLYGTDNLGGKRRQAVLLTLALQNRKIPFAMGGRSPETGFDFSGFIAYILSHPEIGIIDRKDVPYINQPRLMKETKAIKASTLPSDLKPGDLIFYDYDLTMMYLGNDKCRGMMYEGTIETKDVNFSQIIGYSRISYGD